MRNVALFLHVVKRFLMSGAMCSSFSLLKMHLAPFFWESMLKSELARSGMYLDDTAKTMLRKKKECTPLHCWTMPFLVSRCPWFRNHPWFQNHFFWFQNHSWLQNHRFWFQNHPVLDEESSLVSESFRSRIASPKGFTHFILVSCITVAFYVSIFWWLLYVQFRWTVEYANINISQHTFRNAMYR